MSASEKFRKAGFWPAKSEMRIYSASRVRAFVLAVPCLLALAFGGGYLAGSGQGSGGSGMADKDEADFAFEKLGEMSGRIIRLEAQARALVKKMSALEVVERGVEDVKNLKSRPGTRGPAGSTSGLGAGPGTGSKGGLYLPLECLKAEAEGASRASQDTRATLSCLQTVLEQVETAASARAAGYMTLPTRRPLAEMRPGSTFGIRTDPFTGKQAFHSGIDFEVPVGTQILAAGGGEVRTAGWNADLGYVVEIDHGNGLASRYAHASRLAVKSGDIVLPGQVIALAGSTGRSTGPHLHFEIIRNGQYLDPAPYLKIGTLAPNV